MLDVVKCQNAISGKSGNIPRLPICIAIANPGRNGNTAPTQVLCETCVLCEQEDIH